MLPAPACFGQPEEWRYEASGSNSNVLLSKHYALHQKYAPHAASCKELAEKITRLDAGLFKCRCGHQGALGKTLHHTCETKQACGPLLRVKRPCERASLNTAACKRRRTAATFSAVQSRLKTDGDSASAGIFCPDEIAQTSRVYRNQMGLPFLRLLSVGSTAGQAIHLTQKRRGPAWGTGRLLMSHEKFYLFRLVFKAAFHMLMHVSRPCTHCH